MSSRTPTPGKGLGDIMRQVALATELPLVMVGSVIAGGGTGYLLDRYLHTAPVLMLVGGIAGFVGGVWDILRRLSAEDGNRKKGNSPNGE